jgi:hypothetical protein
MVPLRRMNARYCGIFTLAGCRAACYQNYGWTKEDLAMRAVGVLIAGGLALLAVTSADAAAPAIQAAESSVQLGLTGGFGNYDENLPSHGDATGALAGLQAGISTLTPGSFGQYGWPDFYASADYDFSAGWLNAASKQQNDGNGPRNNDYYNTAIVRLGFGRPISPAAEIIPYAVGGYQNWYRNAGGQTSYGAFYQNGMIGGGLKLDVVATPVIVISAAAEALAVIGGGVSAPSQNFSAGFGTSAEERVSLDADYRMSNAWHVFAGLGVSHYGYTGSKPDAVGAYEPLSTTLQINSMFGLTYGF